MTGTAAVRMVDVPDARLHTEAAGTGPVLVLISGGGGDAGMYEQVVPLLAERYTVLTFDRRGNSRSPFTGPTARIDPATQADDVVAVLDAYDVERAHMFGNSGAAIITLELLAHHADRVLDAVVHEAPLVQLLPEDSPARQEIARIGELAVERSPMRAFAAFGAMTAPHLPAALRSSFGQAVLAGAGRSAVTVGSLVHRVTHRRPATMTRMLGNTDLLLRRELPAFCFDHRPDLAALRSVDVPWRLAVGTESAGRPYYVATEALAAELGRQITEFPGGHVPFQSQPAEFAEHLTAVLDDMVV
ncbi:alpha/beta fold hydrolase [Nocardia sp. 2YAB30]|uniref:alpha/beta fold hydrolase n=1 Tax=unclassified Nocardia TaxID=2637762 RepID=UPI003F965B7B